MDFFKNLNLTQSKVLKIVGAVVLGVIALVFAVNIFSVVEDKLDIRPLRQTLGEVGMAPSMPSSIAPSGYGYDGGIADSYNESKTTMPPIRGGGGSTGSDAEAFEVTSYSGTIETRDVEKTCGTIVGWKKLTYVIFENANEQDHGCNYTFKVEQAHAEEILAKVNELEPKELIQNTHTVKRVIEDITSETDILMRKKASIEQTLEDALKAYAEITALATRTQDAESLARVIESKLQTLERLTQERINITEQLERLSRAKAEQLDRLEYTYFSLDVYENKYFDGESVKDSWKSAIKGFVNDLNQIVQDVTINLVVLIFFAAQYLLYFFILLIVIKYVWKYAKRVWMK